MRFEPVAVRDKTGREIILRSAEERDAAALLAYLKTTAAQTPFLIREPDEITLTEEEERVFLKRREDSPRELMLTAWDRENHIGNCSLMSMGDYRRYAHRCGIAIALCRAYWGAGIGRIMLETVLGTARRAGYGQAELEVAADNERAIALYERVGFRRYGLLPNNMGYPDGSFRDAIWMMKTL